MSYDSFRTGLSFEAVYRELRSEVDDPEHWRTHITRRTVLGRWRQLKLGMYAHYVAVMGQEVLYDEATEDVSVQVS